MLETTILRRRAGAAIAWCVLAVAILLAGVTSEPLAAFVTYFATLIVLLVTGRVHHAVPEEQLVRPLGYRLISGATFAVALLGCVVGMLPASSDTSQLLAIFFGFTGLFAYRALVARGPTPTMHLIAAAAFTWVPAAATLLVTCKCGRHVTDWSEQTSHGLFVAFLVLVAALVAVSLLAFRRRTSALPDARLV